MADPNADDTPAAFPSTHWSLVARAAGDDERARAQALGEVVRKYLPPLRSHLVHRRGLGVSAADDLLQDFLTDRVIEAGMLAQYQRERGRFRTFLLVTLDRYASNKRRDAGAMKRAADGAQSLEAASPAWEVDDSADPRRLFDVAWARQVLGMAIERMRAACDAERRGDLWALFEQRLLRPIFEHASPASYGELAGAGVVASAEQAANLLVTAKRKFARALRDVIGEYEPEPPEVEREIAELLELLAGA